MIEQRLQAGIIWRVVLPVDIASNGECKVWAFLQGNGAIEVQDSRQLLEAMKKLLADNAMAEKIAQNGQNVIRNNQGATKKTIEKIKCLVAG